MTLSFSAVIPANIPPHETIVLPISMSQPLERGERLAAIIQSIRDHKYDDRTTILVCDFLNRHNSSDSSSLDQGETFLKEHETILKHFRIVRWQEFISSRNEVFLEKYAEVCDKNKDASHFYLKMKKTWEKCLSATQSLEASVQYQLEEYAAVLCMDEYDHLFYPKRITNGLAYVYNYFSGKKPQYHHIKISEAKMLSKSELFADLNAELEKKDRRHIHIAFRALLDHMDVLLASGELSDKAKKVFAEEVENLLMSYGLLGVSLEINHHTVKQLIVS